MLYVFFVAVLNLCLGYALAVYLAPRLGLSTATLAIKLPRRWARATSAPPPRSEVTPNAPPPRPVSEKSATPPSAPPTSPVADATSPISPAPSADIQEDKQGDSFIEISIQSLAVDLGRYREELIRLDTRLRECLIAPDAAAVDECRSVLKPANDDWLAKLAEVAGQLRDRHDTLGNSASLGASLEGMLLEQTAQIETIRDNIERLDFAADATAGCRQFLGEFGKLFDLAHPLRDRLQESSLAIIVREKRLEALDNELQVDSVSGAVNRLGMEVILDQWWREDPNRIQQASAALLDVDRFRRLNELHGVTVGDGILKGFADRLQEVIRKERGFDRMCRFSGQQFVVFFGDTGPKAAISAIERIRQTLCATSFQFDGTEIEVSVSCSVTGVTVADSSTTLFERLVESMRKAKESGGNRTCLDDGTGPTAVEPLTFEINGRTVQLGD